jgi:hypothetical protein
MIEKRVLKQVTTNLFSFEQREKVIEVTSEEKRAEITLRIKESEIYGVRYSCTTFPHT